MPTAKEVFEKHILSGKRITIKFPDSKTLKSFRSALNVYRSRENDALKRSRQDLISLGIDAPDFVDCLGNKSICTDIIDKNSEYILVEIYAGIKESKQSFEIISVT